MIIQPVGGSSQKDPPVPNATAVTGLLVIPCTIHFDSVPPLHFRCSGPQSPAPLMFPALPLDLMSLLIIVKTSAKVDQDPAQV